MKYNRPQATASWGSMAKDWEKGIDYGRLHKERLARAQEAIRHAGLGGVIAFNFDNIRYITGTHIGEWARDKFMRYAICPVVGEPLLWDPAPPAKRISSPWIADNVAAPFPLCRADCRLSSISRATLPSRSKKSWSSSVSTRSRSEST